MCLEGLKSFSIFKKIRLKNWKKNKKRLRGRERYKREGEGEREKERKSKRQREREIKERGRGRDREGGRKKEGSFQSRSFWPFSIIKFREQNSYLVIWKTGKTRLWMPHNEIFFVCVVHQDTWSSNPDTKWCNKTLNTNFSLKRVNCSKQQNLVSEKR